MHPLTVVWFFFFLSVLSVPHGIPDTQHRLIISGITEPTDLCWEKLACSINDIESMGMADRVEFMKYIAANKLGPLASIDQFRAVEGIIDFFIRKELAGHRTWLSLINAAVVEAIQRGAAISLGVSNDTGNNPATERWAEFFNKRKAGRLNDRLRHDISWASAEQTAVDYGTWLAEKSPGLHPPSARELRWLQFTRIYRTIMQYRRTIVWLIRTAFSFTNPSVPMAAEAFINWVTDITDASSVGFLADIAWTLSALGLSNEGEDPAADSEILLKIATEFWEAFQEKCEPRSLRITNYA